VNDDTNRSTIMNTMYEDLARAQIAHRVEEARNHRRARGVVAARRLSRRAERAAHQARLALARSL
jgi:hypothetical protein